MNRKSKTRITTDDAEILSSNNPFAALSSEGLPDGPELAAPAAPQIEKSFKGRVEVRLEKSGRGGKQVTTLREFPSGISLEKLDALTYNLKKAFACGGSLKDRVIELQGDFCKPAISELKKLGFSPVRSGG